MTNFDPNLKPDYLANWRDREVVYDPTDTHDDDSDVVLWYRLADGSRMPLAARSELMVITGPQKSRKSLLQSCILMSQFSQDKEKTLNFELNLGGSPILHFDTEQAKRRSKKNMRRFHEVCKLEEHAPGYRFLNIKPFSVAQRMGFINDQMMRFQDDFGKSPGLLIIDQVADLCSNRDTNDIDSASSIIDHVDMWNEMAKGRMLTSFIIHTNRGRMNTDGKLGVMLDKKNDCQFHIDIEFDSWISTVTHKEARDERIPKFTFRQDYEGHPRLLSVGDIY
jgi:hypothetical protein